MTAALTDLMAGAGPAAVLVVALTVFAETGLLAGVVLPGDSLLFSAGVLVAAGVIPVPLPALVAAVAVAAVLGDQVGYSVGRRFGPRLFERRRARFVSPDHLARSRRFFAVHGPRAVVLARVVPVARTFVPVVAGASSMSRRRFVAYNVVGAIVWASVLVPGGALLGSVPAVADHLELVSLGVVAVSLLPVLHAARRGRRRAAPAGATRRDAAG